MRINDDEHDELHKISIDINCTIDRPCGCMSTYFLLPLLAVITCHTCPCFLGPGHDASESSDLGVMFLVCRMMCFCYIASTSNWFMQIEPNRCNLNQCDILQSFVKSC